jgi:hypothetical protein
VRRWAVAAAASAAVVLVLSGCGQAGRAWLRPGAAALYGNQRVSAARLAAEVANLKTAYQAAVKARLQPQYRPADMPAKVLSWFLRFAAIDQAAAKASPRITVTPYEAQKALAAEAASVRQSGDTLVEAAVLSGLPPDMLPQLGRWIAIQDKLVAGLDNGVSPTTAAGQQALVTALGRVECRAAKGLNILVNPQYGAFDYGTSGLSSQTQVVLVPSTLAAAPGGPLAGRTPGASKPRLTPPC